MMTATRLPARLPPRVAVRCSAVSLFAGCGGTDVGLRSAGVDVVWANEKNASACSFYEAVTLSSVIREGDIASVDAFPKADLLVGCYPCQGYSQGGLRVADAGINFLYRHFDRALRQIKPLAFVVENVDGMRFSHNHFLLQNQLKRFRLAGYRVQWKVLNALDYGLSQSRKRLFIVGVRSDSGRHFEFPPPTHGPATSTPYRTQRDAIWHLRDAWPGTYSEQPFHWYYMSRNRKQPWDKPAATIVARDRHVALHPSSPDLEKVGKDEWRFVNSAVTPRRLSYIECATLQGFPRPERFYQQSLEMRYRAIGNAVPPPLFKAVASKLLNDVF